MANNITQSINIISQYWFHFITTEILFASILFILILPLTFLLKNRSPYWKYGLWSLLFIRLILPTNFNLSCNIWQYFDNSYFISCIKFESHVKQLSIAESDFNFHPSANTDGVNSITGVFGNTHNNHFLSLIFFISWLIGILVFLIIFYLKKKRFKNIIRYASQIDDEWIITICQNWKEKYQLKRQIFIYVSDKYLSPYTIGMIQPKIFIPQAVIDSNDWVMLKAIIGHELAHIKRYDALWTQLQFLIQVLFFFYPLVWYVGKQLNQAREGLCDLMVLKQKQISPKQYAQSLIQILQFNTFGSFSCPYAPALRGNKQSLKLRINQILENKIMNKKQTLFFILFIILFGFVSLPMASILDDNNSKNNKSIYPKKNTEGNDFTLPIKEGRISSGFGKRMHPIKKVIMHHNGIDIAAPKGTEVYAVADGVVDFAEFKDNWGNKIVLIHENNFSSIYGQLSEILIKKGIHAKAGQLIGRVGNSGFSTAPHLHFEIRENNEPLNPEELIDFLKLQTLNH
jgi:beta-lactamase regulating signal transducer with metallopeptidase domain